MTEAEVNNLANSGDEITEVLDALAVEHGTRLFGRSADYPPDELAYLKRYLSRLSRETSQAISERVLTRRQELARAQRAAIRRMDAVRREQEEKARAERDSAKESRKPDPLPFGASHRGAEELAAAWLLHLGLRDVAVTRFSRDGGVDVETATCVVQVKHQQGAVSAPDVRALFGVAAARGKQAVFFSSAAYTADALAFANGVEMPLLRLGIEAGTLVGYNTAGKQFREQ